MKIKHISVKFIIAFVGTLAAVFVILLTALLVTFRLTMNDHIRRNSFTMQTELDSGVTEVINESAYLYARMTGSANLSYFNVLSDDSADRAVKSKAFETIAESSAVNSTYFNGVTLFTGEYSFSHGRQANLDESRLKILDDNKNAVLYLGNDGGNLIMGVASAEQVSGFEGVFLFSINERRINDMCNPVSGPEGYSFLMRSDGYVISHEDESLVGKTIVYSDVYNPTASASYKHVKLDGVKRIVVTGRAELLNSRYGFDCCIVSVLDYKHYFGYTETMLAIVIAVSATVLLITVVLAVIRAKKISRPITQLSERINSTSEPTRTGVKELQDGDELAQLERNYDEMMNRIFDLVEKNREDMLLQRKLELESLQMQINPHFLYNTLDAISWMAKIKKQPDIDKLVINLAKFFRLFLHNGDKFVTVADEVETAKSYLEIDKIRKPGRATFTIDVQEEVKDKLVLKIILQPIIENSLKHAFETKGGNIDIKVYSQGEDIIMKVTDNGQGFDVPDDILQHKSGKEGGYGLVNVHERLLLQYGDGYGLEIKSQKGVGTEVTARLKSIN